MKTEDRLKQQPQIHKKSSIFQNDLLSIRAGSLGSNMQTIVKEPIFFGARDGHSALPPQKPKFKKMIPTILFIILIQWHILFFIAVALFLMFRYCGTQIGPFIVQIGFLIGYIFVQLSARYLTCKSYSQCPYDDQQYQILGQRGWQLQNYEDLKVGQIIRINNKQRTPVSILPIAVQSGRKKILVDTFPITKEQQLKMIQLIQQLQTCINKKHNMLELQRGYSLVYKYISPMGSIFQADIIGSQENFKISISNLSIIPKGTIVSGQNQIIGVVLYSLEVDSKPDLKRILMMKNGIDQVLLKHLFIVIGAIILLAIIYLILSLILVYAVHFHQPANQLGCYFLNNLALITQSVHITMYFYHALRRLIDAVGVSNKEKVLVKNFSKSLDQFGIVDTIVSDDHFFLKRKLLQLDQTLSDPNYERLINLQTLLKILEQSQGARKAFPDHWLALYKRKVNQQKQQQFQFIQAGFRDQSYGICVKIKSNNSHIFITISQKPRFLSLQSLNFSSENMFSQIIKKSKQKGKLMLLIEVTRIQRFQQCNSIIITQQQLKTHTLLTFKFSHAMQPCEFIKQIRGQYNVVMMSSRSWDILQTVLSMTGLKKPLQNPLIFQQAYLNDFMQQLRYHVQQLGSQQDQNDRILAFDSSLIAHLSRNQVRQSIKRLSKGSHYIFFFNCSQYQKQICATSIFKIFPRNIFFSNFSCDQIISKRSFLSCCLKIAPAAPYMTVQVDSYKSLHLLLTKYASHSIRVTLHILYSHIFKNQLLVSASITAMFLIYKGGNYYTGLQYSQYIFLLYNLFFSFLPVLYYIIKRPRCYRTKKIPTYQPKNLLKEHLRGIVMGIIIAWIAYAFVAEEFANNIFMVILISCVIAANFYHLKNDRALSKKVQIIIIIIQCLIIITVLLLLAFFGSYLDQMIVEIEINLDGSNGYFYVVSFVIQPIVIWMLLFIFCYWSSLNDDGKQVIIDQITVPTFLGADLVAKPKRQNYKGKQMRFRDGLMMNMSRQLQSLIQIKQQDQNNIDNQKEVRINNRISTHKNMNNNSFKGITTEDNLFQRKNKQYQQ